MQSRILASLVLAAALCQSAPSRAADPPRPKPKAPVPEAPAPEAPAPEEPKPTKPRKDKADRLFEKATAAFDEGKLEEARSMLKSAWKLKQNYEIAGNLGIVELKLGHARDAAEHLAFALQHFPATGTAKEREGLQKTFRQARGQVAGLKIHVNVDRAEVSINNQIVGQSPLPGEVFIEAGTVTVKARRDGFEAARQTVEASKDWVPIEVNLNLVPLTESRGLRRSIVVPIVAGGVGVVGLITGGILLAVGSGKRETAEVLNGQIRGAEKNCVEGSSIYDARCVELKDTASSSDTLHNAGVGMVVVGVAATLAAGGAYLFWPQPKAKAAVTARAIPVATANGGGLWIAGAF
jgi:hypothetical protein